MHQIWKAQINQINQEKQHCKKNCEWMNKYIKAKQRSKQSKNIPSKKKLIKNNNLVTRIQQSYQHK